MIAGVAILILAWRETIRLAGGPPGWSPLPAVIACVTLTLILWVGLRERELVDLSVRTQSAMDTLAISINSELERQANAIEKIARRWGDAEQNNQVIWEADAVTLMSTSEVYGCDSIAYLNTDLRTTWVFPDAGNEYKISSDHTRDPVRAATLAKIKAGICKQPKQRKR